MSITPAREKRARSGLSTSAQFTTGELFCGAGGFSRGFHNAGFQPLFANDVWDLALHTYLMNFDRQYAATGGKQAGGILGLAGSVEDLRVAALLGMIRSDRSDSSFEVGNLDVLLGGPPCQGFSLNSHTRSESDPRNHLFRHYVRLLHGLSPKLFVLENVPGMFSLGGGAFLDEFLRAICSPKKKGCPGYDVDFRILNAAHYGVPQERFRVVIVGTRRDVADSVGKAMLPLPAHYSFAKAHFKGGKSHTFYYAIGHGTAEGEKVIPINGGRLLPPVDVQTAIGDLPSIPNGGGENSSIYGASEALDLTSFQKIMRSEADVLWNHWARNLPDVNVKRAKYVPPGGDWRDIPRRLLPPGMQRALRKDHTTRYGRLAPGDLAGTLLTKPDPHWGAFLHYDVEQQRLISVRESARLQSFPDKHLFFGGRIDQYRLCGNAVPPLMAEAIARNVQDVLIRFYGSQIESASSLG
jgi:DNA (cytosine-5)-methyltransferase 1